MNIVKADDERREFTAVVYQADQPPDAQGDSMDADEVRLAQMRFALKPKLQIEHGQEDAPGGLISILGTYTTDKRSAGLPAKAWVICGRVAQGKDGDVLWRRIKAGRRGLRSVEVDGRTYPTLSGFSMAGQGDRIEVTA